MISNFFGKNLCMSIEKKGRVPMYENYLYEYKICVSDISDTIQIFYGCFVQCFFFKLLKKLP